MSLLAPLFIAGLGTLTLPLIFHLIRRTPRGQYTFSSLMFLRPTPPRLTRRSRLDQILLLILRAAALALLVMAFARPFFRQSWRINEELPGRRTVFLLDTSASMRRSDLWNQAKDNISQILNEAAANDQIALYTFDKELRNVVNFANSTQARQAATIEQAVAELYPGWSRTDLGGALARLADDLDMTEDGVAPGAGTQITLISDLQRGAELSALESYQWPAGVALDIRRVLPKDETNATVRILRDNESQASSDHASYRVRVTNVTGSNVEQFYLTWTGEESTRGSQEVPVYVPEGQSRVVQLEAPTNQSVHAISLIGDASDFDNRFYSVPPEQEDIHVTVISHDELDDPDGLSFYLSRALNDSGQLRYSVQLQDPNAGLTTDSLKDAVIVIDALDEPTVGELQTYVQRGGTVICVPRDAESLGPWAQILELNTVTEQPSDDGRYALLSRLDYQHPVFAAFANPLYSDFTSVQFWKYRKVSFQDDASVEVLARFDDDSPALCERPFGEGRFLLLTSGWHPHDSQLALSSKFVPLLGSIMAHTRKGPLFQSSYLVNEQIELPQEFQSATVHKPDGTTVPLSEATSTFRDTSLPGVYEFQQDGETVRLAVNLDHRESDTAPIESNELEQLGVVLGRSTSAKQRLDHERQLRDIELEGRQKVWQWLILAVVGLLIAETWLASRQTAKSSVSVDDQLITKEAA